MNRHNRQAGFTLVELAVVVLIISVLAALAVPEITKTRLQANSSAVMNDLRVFAGAFQAYAQENGDWPPGGNGPGVVPPGMDQYLNQTNWSRVTPIGGHYQWDTNSQQAGSSYAAVIFVATTPDSAVSSDYNQLILIDRSLDDGNLNSGNFFLGYRNYPVFVLEH